MNDNSGNSKIISGKFNFNKLDKYMKKQRLRNTKEQLSKDFGIERKTIVQWLQNGGYPDEPVSKIGGRVYKEYSHEQFWEMTKKLEYEIGIKSKRHDEVENLYKGIK